MKKICLVYVLLFASQVLLAQSTLPYNFPLCSTPRVSDTGYYMKSAAAFLTAQKGKPEIGARVNFSAPYVIRVFIRIVRQSNGTLPGCTMATALQNFNEMNVQYNPHNICFQLVGMDYVNDSYLNNFNDDSKLYTDYPAYIRNNNLDVDGAMTIFVHYNFLNNNGSSGNAYGIPNNFLSVARWAADANVVHSIFGHEMGHCLGLYHTFEKGNSGIQESVTRNTNSSCYNCTTNGDLCCDTPADYDSATNYTNGSSCTYIRNFTNTCDHLQYSPSTINIMSYQPWSCISFTGSALTADQQTRMEAAILDNAGPVYSRVAENNLVLASASSSVDVVKVYSARTNVSKPTSATLSFTGSSKVYFAAGNSIVFTPGTVFSPGTAGIVNASISGCN